MDKYIPPTVTVDSVVFQLVDDELQVLLIQRSSKPFAGAYALPGGYNAQGETTTDATARVTLKKAGVNLKSLEYTEQLYTFDAVARDPRGHAVSVSYMSLGVDITPMESDTTESPEFFSVRDLPDLAYDHEDIIKLAHERLASKISYTNIIYSLLPREFTLGELRTAYETILGTELDKRNFRKKFLALNMIEETGNMSTGHAHRPAKLYRFKTTSLQTLTRTFD